MGGQRWYTINRSTIVIADDSPAIRERLVALIAEIGGFELIGEAESGAEAVALVTGLAPDILVLDMAMPNINGVGVLSLFKEYSLRPLVIVLSNYPDYRERCLAAGADYFFDKSVDLNQFVQLLEELRRDTGPPAH